MNCASSAASSAGRALAPASAVWGAGIAAGPPAADAGASALPGAALGVAEAFSGVAAAGTLTAAGGPAALPGVASAIAGFGGSAFTGSGALAATAGLGCGLGGSMTLIGVGGGVARTSKFGAGAAGGAADPTLESRATSCFPPPLNITNAPMQTAAATPRPMNSGVLDVERTFLLYSMLLHHFACGLPPEKRTVVKCSSGSETRRTEHHEKEQTQ